MVSILIAAIVFGGVFRWGFDWPRKWWLSLHAYPIGMLFCCGESKIRRVVMKHDWIYIMSGAMFGLICVLNGLFSRSVIAGVMRGMIGPIVAMGFYVCPIPQGCRILSFLGVVSLELYLCHGVVRQWMLRFAPNEWRIIVGLTSVVMAILVAWWLQEIVRRMNARGEDTHKR